jgi:hydroxymethylpyrimidine pyrophosphatase-like HAD family hydrolase
MNTKYIFLDIDGTIFDSKIVGQEDIDAIARAKAAGHKVFINTARAYIGLPEQVYELPVDGFVCSYGTEIVVDRRFIHRSFIPRDRVLEVAKYAFERGRQLYFEGEARIDINLDREGGLNPKNMDEFEEMLGESGMCRLLVFGGVSDEDKVAYFPDFDFHGIEAAQKGCTKARGSRTVE